MGRKQKFTITDEEGRAVDGYGMIVPKVGRHPYGRRGMQIHQEILQAAAESQKLRYRALRVWLWVLGNMPPANRMMISQTWIVDDLGMAKSDVSTALSELEKAGLIVRDGTTLFIPPGHAWKGRQDALEREMEERKRETVAFQRHIDPMITGILSLPDGDLHLPRLFLHIVEESDWQRKVTIDPEALAARLAMPAAKIIRGVERLASKGLLAVKPVPNGFAATLPPDLDWNADPMACSILAWQEPDRIVVWNRLAELVLDTQYDLPFGTALRTTAPPQPEPIPKPVKPQAAKKAERSILKAKKNARD